MATRNERTQRLIENYYDDWKNKGMTPLQIADKYRVTPRTMYYCLQEVAINHGIKDRSELLQIPHKPHPKRGPNRKISDLPPVDLEEIKEELNEFLAEGKLVLKDIDKFLKCIEEEH